MIAVAGWVVLCGRLLVWVGLALMLRLAVTAGCGYALSVAVIGAGTARP